MDAKQTPLVDLLRLHADDLHSAHGHNQSSRLLSRAADEVDQLKSNLVALEDEKNSYIDYVGDALGQDHGETLWDAAQRVLSERDRLRAELAECKRDNERLHVAMCQSCVCLNNGETYRGHQIIRAALATGKDSLPVDPAATAHAELAECKRDAERYRWLRRARMNVDVLVREDEDSVWLDMHGWDLDAYVDAALAAKGE